jgi:hypothetical protein
MWRRGSAFVVRPIHRMRKIPTICLAMIAGIFAEGILCGLIELSGGIPVDGPRNLTEAVVLFAHSPAIGIYNLARPNTGDASLVDLSIIIIINTLLLCVLAFVAIKLYRILYARRDKPSA